MARGQGHDLQMNVTSILSIETISCSIIIYQKNFQFSSTTEQVQNRDKKAKQTLFMESCTKKYEQVILIQSHDHFTRNVCK